MPIMYQWMHLLIDLNANHQQESFLGYLCPQAAYGTRPGWDINRVLSTLPPTASLKIQPCHRLHEARWVHLTQHTAAVWDSDCSDGVFFSKSGLKLFLDCWYKENTKRSTYYKVIHLFMCQILHWNFISPSLVFSPEIPRQHIAARYHTAWQKAV